MAGCAPDPSIEQASAADASVWWLGAAVLAVLIAPIARVFWLAGGLAGEWFDGGLAAVAVVLALLTRRGDWVTRWLMPGLLYVVGWQPLLCFVGLRAVRTPWAHTLLWAVEWVPRRLAASIARGDCEAAPVWPAARRRGALAGVLAVAAVTGAMGLHSAQGRDVRGIDGRWYLTAADTLLRTGQFRGRHPLANDGSDPIARAARTPGYPAFLAACRLLAGQGDVRLASALQAVATVGAAAAAFLVAEALAGSLAGVAAGLLVAAYPPLWRDAPLILTEPLAVLLYPLVAHLLVGACRGNRAGLWLLSGFVLGLATLVRPNTLFSPPVVAVCAAGLLWRGGHPPRALARPALVVVGFVVVMMPWWIRNQLALGAFVPGTTLSGVHLWAGNYLPHHGRYRDYAYTVCTRVLHECGDDEVRADRAMMAMARAQAWDNLRRPAALMGLMLDKIGYLVLTPTEGTRLTRLLHPLLLLGAAIGLASLWRSAGSALVAAFFLSVALVHLASYAGEARYFLPLMPLVAAWAGVAVSRLFAPQEHAQSSPERRYPSVARFGTAAQRLRVGIDATYLLHLQKSGVETYTLNLTRALLALPDRPELFLYAAGPERPADAEPLFAAADRARVSPIPRLWLRLRMPAAMAWDGVAVAHFPGTLLPSWLPCPAVTTFYDLAALHYPELYDPSELRHYEALIPSAARRSAAIIAISECTKRDLVEWMGVPEAKVHVTPLGVAPHFAPVPNAAEVVRERHGLQPPYILACVGSGHPRKNLRGVVEAFSRLAPSEARLAIVGTAERDPAAQKAIEASPARERIVRLGHVPEEALPAIYGAAEVFCFPSLFEGFGLPVLEAMACGTPVVCSNTSSLPEVGGEAAVYIDPTDPEALTAALAELLGDEARRRDLGARGVAWARQFTWERTARLTLKAYEAAEGSA